ncbi:hypothetical protein NMY22_g14480 [Coprinellus aureogranulatus]|nr:hypothetical protein NMY22_g14480 [Coprinellus aureogranulatus]
MLQRLRHTHITILKVGVLPHKGDVHSVEEAFLPTLLSWGGRERQMKEGEEEGREGDEKRKGNKDAPSSQLPPPPTQILPPLPPHLPKPANHLVQLQSASQELYDALYISRQPGIRQSGFRNALGWVFRTRIGIRNALVPEMRWDPECVKGYNGRGGAWRRNADNGLSGSRLSSTPVPRAGASRLLVTRNSSLVQELAFDASHNKNQNTIASPDDSWAAPVHPSTREGTDRPSTFKGTPSTKLKKPEETQYAPETAKQQRGTLVIHTRHIMHAHDLFARHMAEHRDLVFRRWVEGLGD